MFKNINTYIRTHYPQLWNTRIVWVLAALVVIHTLFYVFGILTPNIYNTIQDGYLDALIVFATNMVFAVLVGVLFVIIWLVFYLRNNPFKSFYPLPKLYFAKEVALIFITFLGVVLFFKSYSKGFWDKVYHVTKEVNLAKEADVLNMSHPFIPINTEQYKIRNSCDSVEYLSMLETKLSELNEVPFFQRDTFLQYELSARIDSFRMANQEDQDYRYYNYCDKFYYGAEDNVDSRDISNRLKLWLKNNHKDSVEMKMAQLETMLKTYKIAYNLNLKEIPKNVFKDNSFAVNEFYSEYETTDNLNNIMPYVPFDKLKNVLENIEKSRDETIDIKFWLVILYVSLGLTILLFSFRASSLKVCFIALIGTGVLVILSTLITIILGAASEYFILWYMLFLAVLFYALYVFFSKSNYKVLAGINLVWFTWALPAIGFVLYALVLGLSDNPVTDINGAEIANSPIHDFLELYNVELCAFNFMVSFVILLFLLPKRYRTWMAMPEE